MTIEDLKEEAAGEILGADKHKKPRFSKEPIITCAYRMRLELSEGEERLLHWLINITDGNPKNEILITDETLMLCLGVGKSKANESINRLAKYGYVIKQNQKTRDRLPGGDYKWVNRRFITIVQEKFYGANTNEQIEALVLKKALRLGMTDYVEQEFARLKEQWEKENAAIENSSPEEKQEETKEIKGEVTPMGIRYTTPEGDFFL